MTDTVENAPNEAPIDQQVATQQQVSNEPDPSAQISAALEAEPQRKYDFIKPKYLAGDRSEDDALIEQAKAYAELEKRLGGFTGAPESYEVKLSQDLIDAGIEFDAEDQLMTEAMAMAKEKGMNNESFNAMLEIYAKARLAENMAQQKILEEQIKDMGPDGKRQIADLEAICRKNMPEHLVDGIMDAGVNIQAIKAIQYLASKAFIGQPVNPSNAAPAAQVSEAEVRAMQFEKDAYGGRRINSDPAFKAEYLRKAKMVWGDGDYMQVVGG